jgi:hypothetical protein
VLIEQERENTDKQKTKKNNSGLKRRSQRIILKNRTIAIVKTMTHACLKTIKKKLYFSDNFLNGKKQDKGKNNPKLLTVQT